jgi:hypothetical protein
MDKDASHVAIDVFLVAFVKRLALTWFFIFPTPRADCMDRLQGAYQAFVRLAELDWTNISRHRPARRENHFPADVRSWRSMRAPGIQPRRSGATSRARVDPRNERDLRTRTTHASMQFGRKSKPMRSASLKLSADCDSIMRRMVNGQRELILLLARAAID